MGRTYLDFGSGQASIVTRYIGPSNVRGARIVADAGMKRRVYIPYPHELSGEACHRAAAEALCERFGWTGTLAVGGTERGYAYVWTARP